MSLLCARVASGPTRPPEDARLAIERTVVAGREVAELHGHRPCRRIHIKVLPLQGIVKLRGQWTFLIMILRCRVVPTRPSRPVDGKKLIAAVVGSNIMAFGFVP